MNDSAVMGGTTGTSATGAKATTELAIASTRRAMRLPRIRYRLNRSMMARPLSLPQPCRSGAPH
jgi:hypothetical protein